MLWCCGVMVGWVVVMVWWCGAMPGESKRRKPSSYNESNPPN